ncbi:MAG TPA: DNA polymerase ligase N-terminal domain-containing protein [Gemmatimonadaceae bacterium]|nr:DNA polymerase ligase N-terminal domain-containing protein [Gemmatimonadaceae bacterium]
MATRKRGARKTGSLTEYKAKRNFSRTREPEGRVGRGPKHKLHFVIQKHAASHLHFDFRLELDGVMKSWAVPKGPSYDPQVRRLAMQVEDHPIEYNTFEGTIPEGEYGGGTVMLWDRGTYEPEAGGGEEALRDGYERGDLKILMHGTRMRGGWVLVRMRTDERGRSQWLLIKHRDDFADPGYDVVADETTSVVSGRSMEEIGTKSRRVWSSNRTSSTTRRTAAAKKPSPARKTARKKSATARKSAGAASRKKPPTPRTRRSTRSKS